MSGESSPFVNIRPKCKAKSPFNTKVGSNTAFDFQLELAGILDAHGTSLNLFNDIVDLVRDYSHKSKLSFSSNLLKCRDRFTHEAS